jgi:uroporphyrinogen III methyltransferase/synthase
VVGEVVRLREELNWFETRPLFGKRILVTRARAQASGFLKGLVQLGAKCVEFPTIEVVPPESWDALDMAIESLETYHWLLFTSVNGADYFLKRLDSLGKDVRDLKGLKIGAIGPKTAEVWHRMGIKPDLMPGEYRAEAVVECFKKYGIKGKRILLPRATRARELLPQELKKMGAEVDVVPAYQTITPDQDTGQVRDMLQKGAIDMVTFTSSSTVINFVDMFEADGQKLLTWMSQVPVACIGPITARTAQEKGFAVNVIPPEYTIEALTESILQYFASRPSSNSSDTFEAS